MRSMHLNMNDFICLVDYTNYCVYCDSGSQIKKNSLTNSIYAKINLY